MKTHNIMSSIIKVIGVGGGGGNAVNHMYKKGIKGVDFAICNTDSQSLSNSIIPEKIQLGKSLTEGRGSGNKPSVGYDAAIENINDIKSLFSSNPKMVMIIAGMGGGTGTGAAPVIARTAYEMGILTVAIVTIPFKNEGQRRIKQALEGVAEIEKYVDSLLVIDNEKLREMYGEFRISEAFSSADDILATTAKGIAETITVQDYINIDFADVEAIMRRSGVAIMGTALGVGQNRALNATKEALRSPLLNNNKLKGAQNILLNITSGDEVTMEEIGQITDYVQNSAGKDVDLIWGNGNDTSLDSKIRITIIATGFTSNYSINEKSYLDAEGIIKQQFKQDDKYLSLFFIDDEYSPNEIAEIVSLLSDLYKEIGGDELVIKGTNIYEKSKALEPKLI